MPAEPKSSSRKRPASEDATDQTDHRKRRRNRTTQSCLNCHTSKRMCDRGRPCSRCRQLGLTGLCVYEVDDPAQRNEAQDESSRLRHRVAELEGVIRELKNKPHPRWAQQGSTPELEKWHSRAQPRAAEKDAGTSDSTASNPSSSPRLSQSSPSGGQPASMTSPLMQHPQSTVTLSDALTASGSEHPSAGKIAIDPNSSPSYDPYHSSPSPPSTLSPGLMTPTDEFSSSPAVTAGDQHGFTGDFDFTSMFMPYPDLMHYDNMLSQANNHHPGSQAPSQHYDPCPPHPSPHEHQQEDDRHCGCLYESSSYNAVLELSLRLRKAADILSRSANHRLGVRCSLNQRINQLDNLSTNLLGSMMSPLERPPLPSSPHFQHVMINTPPNLLGISQCIPNLSRPTLPPSFHAPTPLAQVHRPWQPTQSISAPTNNFDDGFMSWRGPTTSR